MKNLPEHEAFKALENRLNNYTEQPDDDLWQKVAAALPPSKPVWAPWTNQFAGIVVVAALGWGLGYRSAQEIGRNSLVIAQRASASIEGVAPAGATGSQIHPESTAAKDALPQAGQQERIADAPFMNEKSTPANQGSGSSLPGAGSGLNPNVSGTRSLNQHSRSARDLSSDFDSRTSAHPKASEGSSSSPASSNFSTSNEYRHSNVPSDQSAPYTEAKALDAVVDVSPGPSKQVSSLTNLSSHDPQAMKPADRTTSAATLSTTEAKAFDAVVDASQGSAKQESSLNNLSSHDPQAIKPADGTAATLLTQDPHIKQVASDSSQQEAVFTNLSPADSALTGGQKIPYNRPKKKRTGLSFYALFSPTLSFQTATPSARDGVIIQKFNKPSILSGDRLGLGLETGLQGRLAKKFEYFAGLSVYHQSQTLRYTYQNSGSFVIENGGDDLSYTVKPKTAERSVSYSMLNIGAQAGVLYTLKEHRLSHKIGLGLQYQKGLTQASSGEPYDNASSSYLNYQVLYRAEMALNGRLTFIVQPSVTRTWLVNETLHVPFTLKQYRPGVSLGVSYKLMR